MENIDNQVNSTSCGEESLRKIVSKKNLDSLSDLDKKELLDQIGELEKDGLINNGIKVCVSPKMIKLIRKLTGVHDIKGGAYWGDALYVGSSNDLFNKDLITHESIHVKQQSELNKINFVGFVKWLLVALKDMKKYKEKNKGHKDVNYESTIMIPTELEAYAHSDDPKYLKNRREKAYKKYKTRKDVQEVMKVIEKRNYELEKILLQENDLSQDMARLEEVAKKTKDKEWILYIFNNVDEVNELNHLKELFEKKIGLEFFGDNPKLSKEFEKMRDKYDWEAKKFNLHSYLEDEFGDIEVLERELENIKLNIKKYERAPAKFWLEDKNNKDRIIEIGL